MGDSLLLLKGRLLLRALDSVPETELHALIIRESQISQAKAKSTPVPELVLPCLFEERAAQALNLERQYRNAYWRGLAPYGLPKSREAASL